MFQTKLLFNEAIPTSALNRASNVRLPTPIVIEHLRPLPPSEERENVKSPGSSISFTALSEERLQAAVKLAKRDMRHRRLKLLAKSPDRAPQETSALQASAVEFCVPDEGPASSPVKEKLKTSSLRSRPGTKPSTRNNPKLNFSRHPNGHSVPTKDNGPRQGKTSLSWELIKLQNELKVYVQKVEEQACRAGEIVEEPLDPDEENKLELRREKQAARSSQIIYVLQQQVKKIQEDMDMFRYQKTWDSKKSIAVNRLAAAHRGTLRALQVVIHQLSDVSGGKLPPSYKELGQLIRQLSVCSAKVETENGSVVSDIVLSIMQNLETLDSVYNKQMLEKQLQARACSPRPKSSQPSLSPMRAPKGPSTPSCQPLQKPAQAKCAEKIKTARKQKGALPKFVQQRALRPQPVAARRKGGAARSVESRADVSIKNRGVGFQQPTVSSQLRVNQVPQKEHCIPWLPASPHSSPPRSSTQRCQAEPRCLFSPAKRSASPAKQKVAHSSAEEPLTLSSETKKQAQEEALRKAWLDKMTMMRLKELNRLTREEAARIQTLRSQVVSQTRWAERADHWAGERTPPHVGEPQLIGESQNWLCSSPRDRPQEGPAERAKGGAARQKEAQLENLLEDAAAATAEAAAAAQVPDSPSNFKLEDKSDHRLQTLTLQSMLRHMEEIQRDQDEVRKRNASICYTDPLYWERAGAAGPWGRNLGSGPVSPQPIRLTRPALKQTSAADIVLENPVETGLASDNSLAAEEEELVVVASQDARQPRPTFPGPVEPSRGAAISVASSTLGNIRRYRAAYDAYLRDVSHEAVGSFDPWAVADSLADELLSDALAEVAAEFHDVVGEYAEAVFTSEFLQPIQSPPALTAALASQ